MKLIEREDFLATLYAKAEDLSKGQGHSILLAGEAGMGKSSLIKVFCDQLQNTFNIYRGTCDALFVPRLLAPLYDIAAQMRAESLLTIWDSADISKMFTLLLKVLTELYSPSIIVIEDIHWADESTLDFIKQLARRITHIPCLFILSYRDDEIHTRHPLRNVLGQLSRDEITRLQLTPLSFDAVERMAAAKGYNGEKVYSMSGGNPFYVNEILASYSPGVPDNIRDAILAVYNNQKDDIKCLWDVISVQPKGVEIKYLEQMIPDYAELGKNALDARLLILENGRLLFKQEFYQRTIEAHLSPLTRINLNKDVLKLCLDDFKKSQELGQIVFHATNAQVSDLIASYAPLAAKKSAQSGTHSEAARLYLLAINHNQNDIYLIKLWECYAYECYLTNQHKKAIDYGQRALEYWENKSNSEKTADVLQFLSKIQWLVGNCTLSEKLAARAVNLMDDSTHPQIKARVFGNMAQMKLLDHKHEECLEWGQEACKIAQEIKDWDTLAYVYNSMGSSLMIHSEFTLKGKVLLQESLAMALEYDLHEHVANAFAALGSNSIQIMDYNFAEEMLDKGIAYAEERDMDSSRLYMIACKSRLNLETGNWDKVNDLSVYLLRRDYLLPVIKIDVLTMSGVVKMRQGIPGALPLLLNAKTAAFEIKELPWILTTVNALLEYEWITGDTVISPKELNKILKTSEHLKNDFLRSRMEYWLKKLQKGHISQAFDDHTTSLEAYSWQQLGRPYECALAEFNSDEDGKRRALIHMQDLEAFAVYKKMRKDMRDEGIKVPRGRRKFTSSNSAFLTEREVEVLQLLKEGLKNKEIANQLFISAKTVDHHISAILSKLDVKSRNEAVKEATARNILKQEI